MIKEFVKTVGKRSIFTIVKSYHLVSDSFFMEPFVFSSFMENLRNKKVDKKSPCEFLVVEFSALE